MKITFEGKEGPFVAEKLRNGESGVITKINNQLSPIISINERCVTVPPTANYKYLINQIVFCRVGGNYFFYKIVNIKGLKYQVGDNHGKLYGWIGKKDILGLYVRTFEE
jgi:hypothetical protein